MGGSTRQGLKEAVDYLYAGSDGWVDGLAYGETSGEEDNINIYN